MQTSAACSDIPHRFVPAVLLMLAVAACSPTDRPANQEITHPAIIDTLTGLRTAEDAWPELLNPVALAVDEYGRVIAGDQGDKTVKIYDSTGARLIAAFGGEGGGPGELSGINDVALVSGGVAVLDNNRGRIVRFDTAGEMNTTIPIEGDKQTLTSLGPDQLVLATSARWSLPADDGRPLFQVVDGEGNVVFNGDGRTEAKTPFAEHVMNFVFPASAGEGETLWLAYMNDTRLLQYNVEDRKHDTTINRSVSFDWRRIPADFKPSREMMARGNKADVPFDAVTQAIDTDEAGNVYLLTMLERAPRPGETPQDVAVDVVSGPSGELSRFVVDGPATDLAVSPDGSRLYVLDSSVAEIRVYERF